MTRFRHISRLEAQSKNIVAARVADNLLKLSAIVYCQRVGTPNSYQAIKSAGIPAISVNKNLVSKRKHRDKVHGFKYSVIHQSPLQELKSLNIVLKNGGDLKSLRPNTRTKKTRVSQKQSETTSKGPIS